MNNKKLIVIFLLVIFLKQVLWVSFIPMWQTPDEQAHFAEVQNIAEKNKIEAEKPTTSKEIEISEILLGVNRNSRGENSFTYHPEFKIRYTSGPIGKYEKEINKINKSERKNLVIREASGYPPLYYQLSAIGYKLIYNSGLIDRVFFIRLLQSLLYVLTVLVFYLFAKEILNGKNIFFFLLFISFLPMPSFVGAGITSDNLMNLLFPGGIYLGMLLIKYGLKTKYLLLFGLLSLLGFLTKPHFFIVLPIFWFALLLSCKKNKKMKVFFVLNLLCLIAVPFLLWIFYPTYLHDFLVTGNIFLLLPEIGSLSTLPLGKESIITYLATSLNKTYRETTPWFWGIFRWLSFTLDRWYYRALNLITAISLGFLILSIRKKVKIEIVYLISSVLIYFFSLFFWDYLFFLGHGFSFGIQGRYYFPILFPIIFILYYFFPIKKLLAILSVVFNFYALFKISATYYSINSLHEFIIQASQYKPWFLKGNMLVFLMLLYIIVLFLFLFKLALKRIKL